MKKKDNKLTKLFYKTLTLDSSNSRHLRIADIFAADEEQQNDGDGDGSLQMSGVDEPRRVWSVRLQCTSPRRIIARCLALLRRDKERKGILVRSRSEKREKRVVEMGAGCLRTSRSMKTLTGGESAFSATEGEDSERYRNAASFNLGIGCGLLYLVAASKNELTKMAKLRTEMENLLKNVREELQKMNMNAPLKPIEPPNGKFSYPSIDDVQEGSNSNGHLQLQLHSNDIQPCVLPKLETDLVSDESSDCIVKYEQKHCTVGMDELEAELEAELERLQLNLDTEHSSKRPPLPRSKAIADATPAISQSLNSGEVIDPQAADSEANYGVSPIEVERRLHELVECRQQERIKELEAALECAINELEEKEIEVSWWKDTARLVSQHIPTTSRQISHRDPKLFAC
ncbi:protein POLAR LOCALIZATION DURING ASYMMETRIC DIVISION AND REDISTRIBUTION [Ziziphus jujuba]|uniref:Protein POLAR LOCALIZATION DURING ASYMMETRIC DIVISION AND REDISTRIBUTION n=1 Tax=Ziziphus jujuba TaxID=326968 RepID=A0A6P4AE84_ZIZJJ|nr:protein POLAR LOCALIZATION DURING ASYMMETRIC DIVISION AND REDISTRIBUTION [Ziziphus jujuba]